AVGQVVGDGRTANLAIGHDRVPATATASSTGTLCEAHIENRYKRVAPSNLSYKMKSKQRRVRVKHASSGQSKPARFCRTNRKDRSRQRAADHGAGQPAARDDGDGVRARPSEQEPGRDLREGRRLRYACGDQRRGKPRTAGAL